jgi:type IV pilus assembly protein PilX
VLYVALIMLVLLALRGDRHAGGRHAGTHGGRLPGDQHGAPERQGAARSAENAVENIANRKDAGAIRRGLLRHQPAVR